MICNATRIAVEEIKWKVEGAPAGYRFREGHNATTIMIFYLSQPFVLSSAIIFASCRACNFFRMSRRGFSCLFPSRSVHVNSRFSHRSISASFPQLYQCRSSCETSVERRGRISYADVAVILWRDYAIDPVERLFSRLRVYLFNIFWYSYAELDTCDI